MQIFRAVFSLMISDDEKIHLNLNKEVTEGMQWLYSFCRKSYLFKHFLTCKNINLASIKYKEHPVTSDGHGMGWTKILKVFISSLSLIFGHFLWLWAHQYLNHDLNICGRPEIWQNVQLSFNSSVHGVQTTEIRVVY